MPPVISLVFPTYNAGPAIENTWSAACDFLRVRPDPWEVIFVCDSCTDGTPERLDELVAETGDSRFRVIRYSPNRGKGYAVRVGLLAARGEWRVFTDVDLAYHFGDIARVADELQMGAAVAVASREHPESQIQLAPQHLGYAYRRRHQSQVFGTLARLLLPLSFPDTQAGLKGMTATVAEQVLPNLRCDGFGFDCELLTACARYAIPVTELPVCVRYDDAATSTGGLKTVVRMVRELWRIRRRWPATGFPAPASVFITARTRPRVAAMSRVA